MAKLPQTNEEGTRNTLWMFNSSRDREIPRQWQAADGQFKGSRFWRPANIHNQYFFKLSVALNAWVLKITKKRNDNSYYWRKTLIYKKSSI